jgi:cytochrome c553
MKAVLLIFTVVAGLCVCLAAEPDRLAEGKRLTAEAFALLSKNLTEAIAKDGVPGAIGFCSEKALPLTASVDATLRRVSHKARNPKNKADAAELEILNAFRATMKAGKAPEPQVRRNADGSETFFAPIVLANTTCLKCHGAPGTDIDADTLAALSKRYPQDEATGFQMGELRGMWRVTFPVSHP